MSIVAGHADLARFQASLERCLGAPDFLQRFYARFLLSHPTIEAHFARTNLKKQAAILRTSLYLVLRAAQGHEDGLDHLREVGRTHSSRGYGIGAHEYTLWLHTLLDVAREVDPEFDADCEGSWRACLEPCIALVISHAHA